MNDQAPAVEEDDHNLPTPMSLPDGGCRYIWPDGTVAELTREQVRMGSLTASWFFS